MSDEKTIKIPSWFQPVIVSAIVSVGAIFLTNFTRGIQAEEIISQQSKEIQFLKDDINDLSVRLRSIEVNRFTDEDARRYQDATNKRLDDITNRLDRYFARVDQIQALQYKNK